MKCEGNRLSRRNLLTVGAIGGLGLTLGDFLTMRQARADKKHYDFLEAKAQSVIHIFLPGGMAHQESFDPKPYAPIEYRGELGTVKTNTGEVFCETLPKLASVADKITVIRSMTHGEAAHERGTHNMFTGYRPSPALIFPSMGSVVSHEYGPRNNLPPYVCIPNVPNEFAGTGYLSSSFAPFSLGADPANGGFKVRDLNAARRRRRRPLRPPPHGPRSGERLLRQEGEVRQRRRDEHVLRAGLQPDQLAAGPRGVQHRRRAGRRSATNTAATRPASGC